MDDEELDLFDIDDFLDRSHDVLNRTQSCTHAHACNPSGPDKSHTHTCIHVHTQIKEPEADTAESTGKKGKKRALGNREAVRKYREKKKARNATLEDEVVRLRGLNQQLMKRLQSQGLLEAEIARLKCLLVDIRGRIQGEIGSFPYRAMVKGDDVFRSLNVPGSFVVNNTCNVECDDRAFCCHSELESLLKDRRVGDSRFDDLECLGNQNLE